LQTFTNFTLGLYDAYIPTSLKIHILQLFDKYYSFHDHSGTLN